MRLLPKQTKDHHRREEAGVPLLCRWPQSFPSLDDLGEAKPNQVSSRETPTFEEQTEGTTPLDSTAQCCFLSTELVIRPGRRKEGPAQPGSNLNGITNMQHLVEGEG